MRSEFVFAAAKEISNRFLLCRMTSISARRLHGGPRQAAENINQSLRLIAASSLAMGNGVISGKLLDESRDVISPRARVTQPSRQAPIVVRGSAVRLDPIVVRASY